MNIMVCICNEIIAGFVVVACYQQFFGEELALGLINIHFSAGVIIQENEITSSWWLTTVPNEFDMSQPVCP